ncbi:nuclear receptor 2c2-associated protein [Plasmopara halstedii]|uniref:Nuclear receptor 2c2-associated protein n=1 Tax=Plasmopara halstedii TaxID=4781 RepID=A0A0P1B5L9_PLAHL|nr:nuclear receptor 2c2-associated protein [Plasmopara halstedii]CEG49678.1 nuclear receptor 2c2-associated protein [Plasmopara halstedii]|eukprot:XP_024586047.1 nuclear receptor 2c2-associated protein [Plasmopara halstedii]
MRSSVLLTADHRTTCRASSTLDRNKQLYGVSNILSTNLSSCWNSAQGSPQQVQVHFHRLVNIYTLSIMFQGGFVGQDIQVHIKHTKDGEWKENDVEIDPDDSNDLQEFPCDVEQVEAIAITFQRSTDFYGRVVIYQLQILGTESKEV